jgi:hypothetical protein
MRIQLTVPKRVRYGTGYGIRLRNLQPILLKVPVAEQRQNNVIT